MTSTAQLASVPGMVFHGVSFDPESHVVRRFQREDLDRERLDPRVFSWIDLEAADITALNEVLRGWSIDLVLASHFDAPEILPRIVERPDSLSFYLYEIEDPERHLDTSHGLTEVRTARLILILGANFVITYHRHPLDAVDHVKATCADSFRLAGRTPAFVAFLFLQRCLYDFAQTFLDAAGVPAPAEMQGRSLVPLLKGETPAGWRKSFYYHYYEYPTPHRVRPHYGVVTERYKLVHFYKPDVDYWELYDREKDPEEVRSYYNDPAYADVVKELKQELARLRAELKVPAEAPKEAYGRLYQEPKKKEKQP